MRPMHALIPFAALPALSALIALAAGGCNIVAPVAYAIQGPPTIDEVYKLDKERTTVIFIDDRMNRAPRRSLRIAAAEAAEQHLMQKGVLPESRVITTRAIMRVASQEQFGEPKTIAELGRSVGADVVIYVTLDAWSLSPDGVTFAPGVQARVKIIDAANDARLWPGDGAGHPLTASLPPQIQGMPTGADREQANTAAAQLLGLRLSQLFYEHARDPVSTRRSP